MLGYHGSTVLKDAGSPLLWLNSFPVFREPISHFTKGRVFVFVFSLTLESKGHQRAVIGCSQSCK